jgi:hypothetical protein
MKNIFKLNLISHFQTYLLSIFIVPNFLKVHYKFKEEHHVFIMLFWIILN